jgi:hypothetical protein
MGGRTGRRSAWHCKRELMQLVHRREFRVGKAEVSSPGALLRTLMSRRLAEWLLSCSGHRKAFCVTGMDV